MYVRVCVCVCVCVWMDHGWMDGWMCVYVCMYVCMYVRMYIRMCIDVPTYIVYVYVHSFLFGCNRAALIRKKHVEGSGFANGKAGGYE